MLAALLAVMASVSWGVADYLGGLKSRQLPVIVVLAVAQPIGLAIVVVVVLVGGAGNFHRDVLWAIPAAVLGTVGIAAFYKGMAVGAMSIVAPVTGAGAVIPVAIGMATGDRPSSVQLAGIPLAIGGAVLASRETGPTVSANARISAGVPWAILAAVAFGGYFIPMHAASERDFLWAVLVFKLFVACALLTVFALIRPPLNLDRGDIVAIGAIAASDSGGNIFFAAAATLGLVSVVSVLASLYPVVTVALAWLLLHERIDPGQRLGVAGALVGVVLVSAG